MTKSTAIMTNMNAATRREIELTARSMAQNGTQSAAQLAESYFFLASAGLDAKQSIGALPVVQKFASAGAFDMATATDLLTDAQSALGLSVKDTTQNMQNMTRVSDVLVKANTLSNATVQQFSESLTNKAAAQLRSFNKDVEEGVAVLATFADQGVKGKRAGEGLNIVIREMARTALENKEAWEQFNVSVYDGEGNMRNIASIVAELESSFVGLSDAQKTARLSQLGFTSESQSFIKMLIGTSDKMKEYETQLRNVSGITDEIAGNQITSFSSQLKILWNRFNEINLIIGEALVPILLQLTEVFRDGDGVLNSYDSKAQKLARFFQTTLLTSMMVVADVWYGWNLIIKTGEILLLAWIKGMVDAFAKAEGLIVGLVNRSIGYINKLIEGYNSLPVLSDIDVLQPSTFNKAGEAADTFATALSQANTELDEMMAKGRPSVGILEDFEARQQKQLAAMSTGGQGALVAPTNQLTPAWASTGVSNDSLGWDMGASVADKLVSPLQEAEQKQKGIFEKMFGNAEEFFTESNELAMSRMSMQLDGMVGMFGQMQGESSAAYKALFAIQKAFAIASAIVSVNNAIAKAADGPFPWNLGAMVSVGAATMGLVGTIASTVMSFEGGGYTGSGSRSGGLDGKGGFMAMLHPQERVIDEYQGQSNGPSVTVNNYSNAQVETVTRGDEIEFIVKQAEQRMASNIARGGSPLARTIEGAYKLRRGLK